MKCRRWVGDTPSARVRPKAGNTCARRDNLRCNEPRIIARDCNSRLQRTDYSPREHQLY
jgi:hypothetical protein